MSEIRAVLFDIGGVLLTNGWDHNERACVLSEFGLDKDTFDVRHAKVNDAWEKGILPLDGYLEETIFYEPRNFTPQQVFDRMKAQSRLLSNGAIRILENLAASDRWKLAAVNNEARELNDYRVAQYSLDRYLNSFFSSCYVGLRKPDPKIYQLALDVLRVKPEEAVFIDDREENAKAAAALGIQAIRYSGEAALYSALAELGVVLNGIETLG